MVLQADMAIMLSPLCFRTRYNAKNPLIHGNKREKILCLKHMGIFLNITLVIIYFV